MDFSGSNFLDCVLDDAEGFVVQQESMISVEREDRAELIEVLTRPLLLAPTVEPVVIELVEETTVTVAGGNQGPPGPPGAGAARYVKALTGTEIVIPQAEHGLTGVTFWAARRVSSGREVSLLISISIGGTVTVESLIPMDGITLTLE